MSEKFQRIFEQYEKAIRRIEDLFEYRYQTMCGEEVKNSVMTIIDEMTEQILKVGR